MKPYERSAIAKKADAITMVRNGWSPSAVARMVDSTKRNVENWVLASPSFYAGPIRMGDVFKIEGGLPFVFSFDGRIVELRNYSRVTGESDQPTIIRVTLEQLRIVGTLQRQNRGGSLIDVGVDLALPCLS